MKKIFLFSVLIILSILKVNANFNIVVTDSLFFENLKTKEIKFVDIKTYKSRFMFNYYFLKYINNSEIWVRNKLENWKLIRVERKTDDYNTNKTTIYNLQTGSISVWEFWINLHWDWFTWTLTDITNLKKIWFSDLNYKENLSLLLSMFIDFFWFWFLVFLPLNIIIFFCFGYLLFLLYSKYWIKLFKNIYLNSAFVYIIIYLFQVYYWFSLLELSAWKPFWFMSYLFFVFPFKLIIYLISYYLLEKFNKEYPDKKINYKKILMFYLILIAISILYINISK